MTQSKEDKLQRYSRQMLMPQMGVVGQERLLGSKVVIIGCGGLGGTIGQILARAGVGELTLCDSDRVELGNLHRQLLFDEKDLGKPKAIVAGSKLMMINSQVKYHVMAGRVDAKNIEDLIRGCDLVVDATDNLPSRYVLNRAAVRLGRDWIYGGCVGTEGTVMVVRSRSGACLECVFGPEEVENGKTTVPFPILPPTPVVVGAIQANEVLNYLLAKGKDNSCGSKVISIDLGQVRVRSSEFIGKNPECGMCKKQ
jgi:molybdopterin/thiamine biosynthesis adenylyltransferase